MKLWWQNVVKDYFTFSKKERLGIIVLIGFCVLISSISRLYPVKRPQYDKTAFQKELAQLTITVDSSPAYFASEREDNTDYNRPKDFNEGGTRNASAFFFDPNTLDEAGWRKLGIREKTIHTIQKFVSKGYRFRKPEDLKKIYGLHYKDAERLMPFVRIPEEPAEKRTTEANELLVREKRDERRISTEAIDINKADSSAFIALPGIGNKLASRIINFRQKLGGFHSVSQVAETYGIPDSTFQKIKTRLACNNATVAKININSADANQLKNHPYIRWNIANAIMTYRKQHGEYKSVEDLRKIEILTDESIAKLAPYLEF